MDDNELAKPAVGVPFVHGENYRTFYANLSRMSVSAWDIRFTLGQVMEKPPGIQINQDEATFVMTPAHAKVFCENLAKTLEQYEKHFGEIIVPAAVRNQKSTEPEAAAKPAAKSTPPSASRPRIRKVK